MRDDLVASISRQRAQQIEYGSDPASARPIGHAQLARRHLVRDP
ncbi:hypothetical protein ABIB25_001802 [Nakamurella sp. UYEF19]